jgi:hypothetical protein
MAKFSLKNGVVQKKLFKNEGTKSEPSMISSSKMSEDFMEESISAAIPADLITSITEDLKNVPPQTDTKLNTKDFAYTESIDKKYGIKKTLGDIIKPTQTASKVEVVFRYSNADVKANPNKIYIFGDNTQRKGTAGQAQIRNNENAFGIATKLEPNNNVSAFMSDNDLQSNKDVIDSDINKIKADGRELVLPKDGFGTGLAKLKQKAPQTYAYLKQRLQEEFGFNNDTGVVSQPTATGDTRTSNIAGREITYTIDQSLSNTDGSKRFAEATKEDKIFINPVTNLQDLYDYMEGKEGGATSKQKLQVLKELEKQGYTIDRIKSILSSKKLANSFLILHEQDHIDNNDRDVYWKNGKDLLTPDKIAIETRATIVALKKLDTGESDMQQSKLTITEEQLKTINDNLGEIPWLLSMSDFNAATRAEQEKLMHCLK